jgi:hypothetical protein
MHVCRSPGPIRQEEGNIFYEEAYGLDKDGNTIVKFFESWSSIRTLYKHIYTSTAVSAVFRSEAFKEVAASQVLEGPFQVLFKKPLLNPSGLGRAGACPLQTPLGILLPMDPYATGWCAQWCLNLTAFHCSTSTHLPAPWLLLPQEPSLRYGNPHHTIAFAAAGADPL